MFPARDQLLAYVTECGRRYWRSGEENLIRLPITNLPWPQSSPLTYCEVRLPEWASDLGVNGSLLAPQHCFDRSLNHGEVGYAFVDWWQAVFLMVTCWDEYVWERKAGPVHSYSLRLKGFDSRIWDRAWVNRAFLFLRRWAARNCGKNEEQLFGELPRAEIKITHDLDAIGKSLALRVKAGAFHSFNSVRYFLGGDFATARRKLKEVVVFPFTKGDYWCFPLLEKMEADRQVKSHYYIFSGTRTVRGMFERLVFDPAYTIAANGRLISTLRRLNEQGHTIGLHQSFRAWHDPGLMSEERKQLEESLQFPVATCRQHWLRFSWAETWLAQSVAGLKIDSTLGFNDRSGFRNSAALSIRPWFYGQQRRHDIESLPLILMDSQLYDYQTMDTETRHRRMEGLIDEVKQVRGTATVLWHQHVLSSDYGWKEGFEHLLRVIP